MKAKHAYPLLLASGALLSLAFPEPDIAPLAWVLIAPLLYVARAERGGRGFLAGYIFGLGFFGALLHWVSLIGWVAWGGTILIEAAFIGLFGLTYALASRRAHTVVRILGAASLWVAFEYLRSIVPFGGFTWGQLGQSQHDLLWMLRPAAWGGGWLVTFLLVAVNACVVEAAIHLRKKDLRAAGPALVAALLLLGGPLLLPAQDATGESVRVGIVQGNVPRHILPGFGRDLAILESHQHLTEELAGEDVDVVMWPENSLSLDIVNTVEAQVGVEDAARAIDAPIVAGGNLDVDDDYFKVMAFHISPQGRVVDRYQKTHLVPFGEYVPLRFLRDWIPMLDQVERDAIPGDDVVVFDVDGKPIAPVISFEGDFGSLVRTRMEAGGRLLTVLTNTSTWGETWASAQHVAFSQLRAAENGVWVAHAAISGISAFIQPDGRVVERLPLWTAASAVREINMAEDVTFYARVGDWVPLASALVGAAALGLATRRREIEDPAGSSTTGPDEVPR